MLNQISAERLGIRTLTAAMLDRLLRRRQWSLFKRENCRLKDKRRAGLLEPRHDCIEPFDLTITEAADILGVTRQALNNIVNGKSGISPEMAIRLDKAFGGGAETWLRLQMAYDLAQTRQREGEIKVRRVVRRKVAEPRP